MMASDMLDAQVSSSTMNRRLVLLTMCLGVLIAQLDTSVVNLALAPIGVALHAPVNVLQWVVDAYNVVYASLLLTAGTLSDIYGRRRIFALGVTIFTLGSLICGFAPDQAVLIAGRGLTGVGAALVIPTSLAILAVAYPDAKERAHAIGIWAACYGLALAIGPTAGGLLVHQTGWRSIFLMIVPISALALVLTLKAVPESRDPRGRHLDLPGQVLAVIGLAALTFAAIEAPYWGWQTIALCLGVSVAAFVSLLVVEARTARTQNGGALLPLVFLKRPGLAVAMAVASLMTFGMYGMLFLVPLYLQQQHGASVVAAGFELLPLSLLYVVVSPRSGPLASRFGARGVMTAGMALMGIGSLALSLVTPQTSLWVIEVDLAILGIGLGLNTGPVNSVAVAHVEPERLGTASGLLNTARMIGATLGVAIMGAVFAHLAGQGTPASVTGGLHRAFLIGGGGELLGAAIAFFGVGREALGHRQR